MKHSFEIVTSEERNNENCTVVDKNGKKYELNCGVLKECELFKNLMDHSNGSKVVNCDINPKILEKVIEFCRHFENEPEYLPPSNAKNDNVELPPNNSWEMKFLEMDPKEFKEFIDGVNFLNVPRLFDNCCFKLNHMIRKLRIEEVREMFNLSSETKEEESTPEKQISEIPKASWIIFRPFEGLISFFTFLFSHKT